MLPSPTACRRLASGDGWVLFFYGRRDVLAAVFDVPQTWRDWDWSDSHSTTTGRRDVGKG